MTTHAARRDRWRARWETHRSALVGLFLVVVSVGAAAVDLVDAANNELPTGAARCGAALTVAVGVALWWRRRAPLLLAAAACAAFTLGASQMVLSLALLSLAVRRRDRWLAGATAGAVAARSVVLWRSGLSGGVMERITGEVFLAAVFIGLPVVLGAFLGARRDLLASLRERAERAEAEQHLRAEQARAAERSRIAREMHDALGHRISLVALHAGGLEVSASSPQAARSAELIRTTAREALQDLRAILGVLREDTDEAESGSATSPDGRAQGLSPAPAPDLGDVPALVRASAEAGARVRLIDEVAPGAEVPALVGSTAYRVAQEALTNVHKHATHAATTVRLSGASGDALVVEVVNARPTGSTGVHSSPGSGLGLVGLGERVHLAHGHLETAEAADGGFLVRARLPWPAAQDRRG